LREALYATANFAGITGSLSCNELGDVFLIYLASLHFAELEPTWQEILASYALDPAAAQATAPAPAQPTATPLPQPPPTVAPASDALAPPPGQSRLYLFNEFAAEITFDIGGQAVKIPTGTPDDARPLDLAPGKYTYTISLPGGAVNGEIELGPDQSWAIGVRGDGVVYLPYQVYP
jgi:hypothetical protein